MEFFLLKTIPLTQNKVVTVDDSDFETLSKFSWHAAKRGQRFYAARREGWKGPMVYMHRQLVGRGGLDVDHIDGDGLNNQRKNLRAVTRLQNLCGAWKKRKGHPLVFPESPGPLTRKVGKPKFESTEKINIWDTFSRQSKPRWRMPMRKQNEMKNYE